LCEGFYADAGEWGGEQHGPESLPLSTYPGLMINSPCPWRPADFQRAGEIIDDDLNRMLINPLPQGVKLHAIIDACHSGSVMDLPYQATVHNGVATWEAGYAGQTRGWKVRKWGKHE